MWKKMVSILFSIAQRSVFVWGWRQAFSVRTEFIPLALGLTEWQSDGENATAKGADAEFGQRHYSIT
jgi:hypothetical protein